MNTKLLRAVALSAIASCIGAASHASGSPLRPGESYEVRNVDEIDPTDVAVTEQELGFALDMKAADGTVLDMVTAAGMDNLVRRRSDGMLTFEYDFSVIGSFGMNLGEQGGGTTISGFENFTTDVLAHFGHFNPHSLLSRSSDGVSISMSGPIDPGQAAGSPYILVNTNATEYDSNGHASYNAFDEYQVGSKLVTGRGVAEIDGLYEPAGQPAPTIVPLPPAAPAALVVFAGFLATRLRRRTA